MIFGLSLVVVASTVFLYTALSDIRDALNRIAKNTERTKEQSS